MKEAHSLLGISEEMTKEEVAAEAVAAADFMAWKEARRSQPQPVAAGCSVEWGDHGDFHVSVIDDGM